MGESRITERKLFRERYLWSKWFKDEIDSEGSGGIESCEFPSFHTSSLAFAEAN